MQIMPLGKKVIFSLCFLEMLENLLTVKKELVRGKSVEVEKQTVPVSKRQANHLGRRKV